MKSYKFIKRSFLTIVFSYSIVNRSRINFTNRSIVNNTIITSNRVLILSHRLFKIIIRSRIRNEKVKNFRNFSIKKRSKETLFWSSCCSRREKGSSWKSDLFARNLSGLWSSQWSLSSIQGKWFLLKKKSDYQEEHRESLVLLSILFMVIW
jgi:hypothetical protein